MYKAKYFSEKELQNVSSSPLIINDDSLARLDALREHVGAPLVLNSAYRSVEHEKAHNRSGLSAHTRGRAFDIRCFDPLLRWKIVVGALAVGFNRIGIGKNYIHVDDDPAMSSPRIWVY